MARRRGRTCGCTLHRKIILVVIVVAHKRARCQSRGEAKAEFTLGQKTVFFGFSTGQYFCPSDFRFAAEVANFPQSGDPHGGFHVYRVLF